jgi:hypothetical protein
MPETKVEQLFEHVLEQFPVEFTLPDLPQGVTRKLYISSCLPQDIVKHLGTQGYILIDVRTLPRDTSSQIRYAITAALQGMSEGTILATDERRKTLELEAAIHGFKITKSVSVKATTDLEGKSVEELLQIGAKKSIYGTLKPITQDALVSAMHASTNTKIDTEH